MGGSMIAIFRARLSGPDTWHTWGRGLREHGAVTVTAFGGGDKLLVLSGHFYGSE